MTQNKTTLERLIALKRHEVPSPGFFNTVEQEFHRRLRAEVLRQEQGFLPVLGAKISEWFSLDSLHSGYARMGMAGSFALLLLAFTLNYQANNLPPATESMASSLKLSTELDETVAGKSQILATVSPTAMQEEISPSALLEINFMDSPAFTSAESLAESDFQVQVMPVSYEESTVVF